MIKEFSFVAINISQLDASHDVGVSFDTSKVYAIEATSQRFVHLLMLAFSMYHDNDLMSLLQQWGWEPNRGDVHRTGLQVQISWQRQEYVRQFWAEQRTFSMSIELALGGALVGWIQRHAHRDLEVLRGVMENASCRFVFSMHIDSLFSLASLSVGDIMIGNHRVDMTQKPRWVELLMLRFHNAVCQVRYLKAAELAQKRLLSIAHFADYQRFCQSLGDAQELRLVQLDGQMVLLYKDELVSLYGEALLRKIQHAAALYLSSAVLLCIDEQFLIDPIDTKQYLRFDWQGLSLGKAKKRKSLVFERKNDF